MIIHQLTLSCFQNNYNDDHMQIQFRKIVFAYSVTRFGEISPLWQNFKSIWLFFQGIFCFGQNFESNWQNFYDI